MAELVALSLAAAAAALAHGDVSSAELTSAYLDRIAVVEPDLNAYVSVDAEGALAAAEQADALLRSGEAPGPLCGIPLGLKDLFDVRGQVTTAGSPLLRDNVAGGDSTVAARLRAAGSVLLGKQATHEFAWGGTTNNAHFGPTRNPHDRTRIPGGSSGGSAASVVARTCAGAMGTDACGSVRIPAALSGCVGLKPTYGRISLHRAFGLAPSLDHAGPIARTVRDAALLYTAVAGFDPADARTLPVPVADVVAHLDEGVRGLRVGRLRGWFDAVLDPDVRTAVDAAAAALQAAGATVVDVSPALPDAPVREIFLMVAGEAVPSHWARFGRDAAGYSPELAALLSPDPPSAEAVATARETVASEVGTLVGALHEVDLLLCATEPMPAPTIGAERVAVDGHDLHIEYALTRLTSIFDAARLPAVSVPFGRSRDGLPVGVQLAGRHLDEATVLRAARSLERERQ